jgi:outer membrane protein assembly factor BamB
LVVFMADAVVGFDPDTGELQWSYPHRNQWQHNIAMPLVVDDILFLSSPQAGARGVRLSRADGTVRAEEVWIDRRIQLYHGSPVRIGDWVYGSSGVTATAFLVAVNVRTGEVGWRQRGFAKANLVGAGDQVVILDENGRLAIATPTPAGLEVHAESQLLDRAAWTAPTLVGTTLFVRDRGQIVATALG